MTTKINDETVLGLVVKPINETLFKGQCWILQQNSALSHQSKCRQEWLANKIPAIIRAEECTYSSPDLNLLDQELCHILEQNACRKRCPNLQLLKRSINEEMEKIP